MMHLGMIGIAIATACLVRLVHSPRPNQWPQWSTTLPAFVVPPLLLLVTAIAIVMMGPDGSMVVAWEGWGSYLLAWGFIICTLVQWLDLSWQAIRTQHRLNQYPQQAIQNLTGRVIDTAAIFSAQVGVWQPQLVVSQGLLDQLAPEHLTAVLAHEAAHADYHDTVWCFWLGGLRRLTAWLPHTESLWQDLLLLREIRADRKAALTVDSLTLAEALLQVIAAPIAANDALSANFSCAQPSRLARRIDALLAPEILKPTNFESSLLSLSEVCLSLTPLLTIPFHH